MAKKKKKGNNVQKKQAIVEQPKRKMDPKLLRLMVIFPNVLSYLLLIGVIFFTFTNLGALQDSGNLWFWLLTLGVLAFLSISTTISISKKLKAGTL